MLYCDCYDLKELAMAYWYHLVHNPLRKTCHNYKPLAIKCFSITIILFSFFHLAARYLILSKINVTFILVVWIFCSLCYKKRIFFFFRTPLVSIGGMSVHVRVNFFGGLESFPFAEQAFFTAQYMLKHSEWYFTLDETKNS